jgi:hypothetical protein
MRLVIGGLVAECLDGGDNAGRAPRFLELVSVEETDGLGRASGEET